MMRRDRPPGAATPPEDDAMADGQDGQAPPPDHDLAQAVEALIAELVEHQERRLVALGQRLHPGLSRDDLHGFDDVPALARDPQFVYEDGHYAGLLGAQAALRALLRRRAESSPPGPEGRRDAIFSGPDECAR